MIELPSNKKNSKSHAKVNKTSGRFGVRKEKLNHQVIIELGSNIEPEKYIPKAKQLLSEKFKIISESKFVKTKPIGGISQPDFINGAVLLETELSAQELKTVLKSLEEQLGRKKGSPSFGPRTMDLDIVVWNDEIVDSDFYKRAYLKESVLELCPDLRY